MSEFYTNVQVSKNNILYSGYQNGKRKRFKKEYYPTIYVSTNKPNCKFKALDSTPVESLQPGTIRETRDFIKENSNVSNFKIYGQFQANYCYIDDNFKDDILFESDLIKIGYIDIEVDSKDGFAAPDSPWQPVTAITIKSNGICHVFGCKEYINNRSDVHFYLCDDEKDLLTRFLYLWKKLDLDIISGWNIQFFDIPYLINRCTSVLPSGMVQLLSPWKEFTSRSAIVHGREQEAINIVGISILDYMEMYKKFNQNQQESYKLDYIANAELGEGKLSYAPYNSLAELYEKDFQKYIEYNIKDTELIERFEKKMKFINMALTLAYHAKVNYNDVFSQVRMWDTMIRNYLLKRNVIIPNKIEGDKNAQYVGAYVKDPIIGMHDWIVSFDLASLYPHLIMQFNVSPETLTPYYMEATIDGLVDKTFDTAKLQEMNLCLAANGHTFRRDVRGFLPEMMEFLYVKRSDFKKEMMVLKKSLSGIKDENEKTKVEDEIKRLDSKQNAFKVMLNSAYGALGNSFFRHYDVRQAEAVTKSGQLVIRWIENKINLYLNGLLKTNNENYIIAGDTDSIYITLDQLVKKVVSKEDQLDKTKVVNFIDRVCEEKLQPYINTCYQELADYVNAYDQKMTMKREIIADRGIWTAKKRYILNVYDNEGVRKAEPEIKIMGLEAIKSSTPHACRTQLKDAMKIVLQQTEEDIIEYVDEFRKKFSTLPLDEIAFPRGVNGIEKYHSKSDIHTKGTPIHVRGALVYNHLINEHKIDTIYEKIKNGDKLKFIYLFEPNTAKSNVIAILNELPKELNLEKYIDYETQFNKAFLEPLKIILNSIGWKAERISSLEGFFN